MMPSKGARNLGLCYLRLDAFDVGIQRGEFGLDLLVGFLADSITFQQGILTEYAVFG